MSRITAWLGACLLLSCCVLPLAGQQAATTAGNSTDVVVPPLVSFSGVLTDMNNKPLNSIVDVTFALYKDAQGGAPLWLETQNVQPDKNGRYSVMLGSASKNGIPSGIFAAGEARWLGVQVAGQAEQPRTLLMSVPYALKAVDAETVGGLPASAFVRAAPPATPGGPSSPGAGTSGGTTTNHANAPDVGGTGTTNYLPIWKDNNGTLGNSVLYQSTSSPAKVGIGTTTPASTLDVKGGSTIRGLLTLPTAGTATASKGFNSQAMKLAASAFNSGTATAVPQNFQWQAEPVGNNTPNATGSLNLLFGQGTSKLSETGLNIASNGLITFAANQTFPGTGTITGVTAGTDLTGGGKNGNVTLNLDLTKVPQLNTPNAFNGNQTVTGNVSATNQLISTVAQGTAPLQVTSTTLVPNLNASLLGGYPASAFQPAGSYATLGANTFIGTQTISSGNLALPGTTGSSVGVITMGGIPFLHNYPGTLAAGNAFVGGAGNFSTTGIYNTATGSAALQSNTTGGYNTASGFQVLLLNTTGQGNTASGYQALQANTTGTYNTANGTTALHSNTTGANNTAGGGFSLVLNTTGNYNTASGYGALYHNTTGSANEASGSSGLGSNTTGSNNTASGYNALGFNTTGSNNTALGYYAGPDSNSTNLANATAIGANAVVSESNALVLGGTGSYLVNVGNGTAKPQYTLDVNGTGNFTGLVQFASGQKFPGTGTITGVTAGTDLTGGGTSGNVTLNVDTTKVVTGVTAGTDLTGGGTGGVLTLNLDTSKVPQLNTANTFTGNQTVNGNLSATGTVTGSSFGIGSNLFAFGSYANSNAFLGFAGNTNAPPTGGGNTASGYQALFSNTSGIENTASGESALYANTEGYYNTASGAGALYANTEGYLNTASGDSALYYNTTGNYNTASGAGALYANHTGNFNTASGFDALASNTGGNNTAIGGWALTSNTEGSDNTGSGFNALNSNTTGGLNTASGYDALASNTTGDYNTAIGGEALRGNRTGNYNTAVGYGSGVSGSFTNATAIGAWAVVSESNALVLGGTGTYAVKVGIGTPTPANVFTIAQGAGVAISDGWTTYSSRRWKTNIHTLHDALAKVEQLRGVSYDLKANNKHEVGVIAEEVGAVVPEVVTWEKNGKDAQSVDYGRLTALLIEATKEQQALIHKQQEQIRVQQAQINEQQKLIGAQQKQNKVQQARIDQLTSQVRAIQALLKTNGETDAAVRRVKTEANLLPTGEIR